MTDHSILREMIRLAENRRAEALEMLERVNKYNLGIIAFAGSFLSLLVTVEFPKNIVAVSGALLIVSIIIAFFNINPKPLQKAAVLIDKDVEHLKTGGTFLEHEYLLAVAELTSIAAENIDKRAIQRKKTTTLAALFLALSLVTSYGLYVYA